MNLHSWGISCLWESDETTGRSSGGYKRPVQNVLVQEPGVAYASRYVDPLTDFGFKYLFGRQAHKHILIDFLNELFKGKKGISDVHFHPTEQAGPIRDVRKVIVDLLCTDDKGNNLVIEMQRSNQAYFMNRVEYYASRLISDQLPPGEASRKFPLADVDLVGLLNFSLPDSPRGEYLHTILQVYAGTCKRFPAKRTYTFVELVKFNKGEDELITGLDQWLYAFRNLGRLNHRPVCLDKPVFREVFDILEVANLKKEELQMLSLQSSLQDQYDYEHVIDYTARQAKEEGWKTGRIEGREEGRVEGQMEGESKMKAHKELLFVQALIRDTGFNDEKIATLAAVPETFVKKVRSELGVA